MFCHLEHDKKTLTTCKLYLASINSNEKELMKIDAALIINEINDHLWNNRLHNNEENKIEWVNRYAKNFRKYLNTLKMLALYLHMSNMTEDNFYYYIDSFNNHKNLQHSIMYAC